MTMTERTTAVGVFTDRAQAEQAINDLHNLGFTDKQIGYVVRNAGNELGDPTPAGLRTEIVVTDAVSVGVFGGILGAAASLLIPGFGPAIAGGILAATLGGAAIGAAAGGLIGALTNMGVPEEYVRVLPQRATLRQPCSVLMLPRYGTGVPRAVLAPAVPWISTVQSFRIEVPCDSSWLIGGNHGESRSVTRADARRSEAQTHRSQAYDLLY